MLYTVFAMSKKYTPKSGEDKVPAVSPVQPDAFIGIDFHKRYSVYHVIDSFGKELAKGRIEHHSPEAFLQLVKRWQNPRVVFEATMNWHWLFELKGSGGMKAHKI